MLALTQEHNPKIYGYLFNLRKHMGTYRWGSLSASGGPLFLRALFRPNCGQKRGIRDVLNYLNNLLKEPKVVAKCNRFPFLYGIADTRDGHIKLAGKIGQRHFQLTRRPVT